MGVSSIPCRIRITIIHPFEATLGNLVEAELSHIRHWPITTGVPHTWSLTMEFPWIYGLFFFSFLFFSFNPLFNPLRKYTLSKYSGYKIDSIIRAN